jgi:hypothetical protein
VTFVADPQGHQHGELAFARLLEVFVRRGRRAVIGRAPAQGPGWDGGPRSRPADQSSVGCATSQAPAESRRLVAQVNIQEGIE